MKRIVQNLPGCRLCPRPNPHGSPYRLPSVKTIHAGLDQHLVHEGRATAGEVRAALERVYGKRAINEELQIISQMLGGHGVEAIRGDEFDSYWGDTVAVYVNMGDTYTTTVLFDVDKGKFEITSYGDWIEREERRGRKIP